MSDVVTYIKNGTTYVVDNPTTPIAADAWYDQPRLDSSGDPVLDDQNRVVVDRYVNRTSVDISNCVTNDNLSESLAYYATKEELADKADLTALSSYATTKALSLKADSSSLANYLALEGGSLTGGVSESVASANNNGSGTITLNANTKCIYPIAATGDITFNLTGSAGSSVVVVGTNLGNYTITYPNTVAFSDGVIPTLTEAGKDILMFFTNNGANWYGVALTNVLVPE